MQRLSNRHLLLLWFVQAGGTTIGIVFGGLLFTHRLHLGGVLLCMVAMMVVTAVALLIAHWEEAGRW